MSTPETAPRPEGPRLFAKWLVPPDFLPERQIDTGTWAEAIFEPVALIGAVVCFALGIVQFGTAIAPAWPSRFVAPLSVLVGIEAFLYSRRLARSTIMVKEWLTLLLPVLVLVRLLAYLDDPSRSLVADVASWWSNPAAFFSVDFLADCFVLLVVWWLVFSCTQYLNELRLQPGELIDEHDARLRQLYEDNWRAVDHSAPLRQLATLFVWGAVILVILSALASIGTDQVFNLAAIAQLIGFQRPSLQLVQVNDLLYVLLGLLLLGEAHFVRQRTLWRLDRLTIPTSIPQRWVLGALGLVGVALVVAFVLPTSYAMTLGQLVTLVVGGVLQLVLYAVAAFIYLFYLLASLFPGHKGNGTPNPAPVIPHMPAAAAPPPSGSTALDTIRSLIFWAVALGLVLYSLSVLWRKRGGALASFSLTPIWRLSTRILRGLWRLVRRVGADVGRAVAAVAPRLFHPTPPASARAFRFLSLSRLGPRELVEYFYLSVCERAARLGHPRPPGVTPIEYQAMLRQSLPLVDPELEPLTAAFLEARYGPRPTGPDEASRARRGWEALKKKLRASRLRRGKPAS